MSNACFCAFARRLDTLTAVREPKYRDEDHAAFVANAPLASTPALASLPGGLVRPSRAPLRGSSTAYSLHAALDVHRDERKTLERPLTYGMRLPFALRRLSLTSAG